MSATVSSMPLARSYFYDTNGNPLAGGSVAHYTPGTLTPVTTYSDYLGTTPNANPLTLDAGGGCEIYGNGSIRQIVKDSLGNTIYDQVVAMAGTNPNTASITTLRALTGSTVVQQLYMLGYAAAGDGGQGAFVLVSSDTTSSDDGGTIIVDTANRRWYRDARSQPLSVKWFGAKGDGTTDDTAAIQRAITAAQAQGRSLYVPGGTYKVSTISIGNGLVLFGDFNGTVISSSSATAEIFDINALNVVIRDLTITSSVTRTAGVYIAISTTSSAIKIERVNFTNHFTGVTVGANAAFVDISHCVFYNCVSHGFGIILNGGNDIRVHHCSMNTAASPQPAAGIQVTASGAIIIDDVDIIQHDSCLLINPGSGQQVDSLYVSNSFFDTSSSYGLCVLPSGTGVVQRSRFIGCWFSAHTLEGILISVFSGSSATVNGLEFIDCHILNNAAQGVLLNYGSNFIFMGCEIAGNTAGSGIVVSAGISDVTIIGNTIGPVGGYGANTYGIFVSAGASDKLIIIGNQLEGNSTAALSNSGTGTNQVVRSNLGYISAASGAVQMGAAATTVTVTHGLSGTPPLANILLTMSSGIGSAQLVYVSATGPTTFTIAAGAAPGVTIQINWRATLANDA